MSANSICSTLSTVNHYLNENGNVLYGIRIKQRNPIRFEIGKTSTFYKVWLCFKGLFFRILPFTKSHSYKVQVEITKQLNALNEDILKAASQADLIQLNQALTDFEKNIQKKSSLLTRLFGYTMSFQSYEKTITSLKRRITHIKSDTPPKLAEGFIHSKKLATPISAISDLMNKVAGYLETRDISSFSLTLKHIIKLETWLKNSAYFNTAFFYSLYDNPSRYPHDQKTYEAFLEKFLFSQISQKIEKLKVSRPESISLLYHYSTFMKKEGKNLFPILTELDFENISLLRFFEDFSLEGLSKDKIIADFAQWVALNCPNLKCVKFGRSGEGLPFAKLLISKLTKLEHASFDIDYRLSHELDKELLELLNSKKTLKSLAISFACKVNLNQINALAHPSLNTYKNSLELWDPQVILAIPSLNGLQKLRLVGSVFFDKIKVDYIKSLTKFPCLEEVVFSYLSIDVGDIKNLQLIPSIRSITFNADAVQKWEENNQLTTEHLEELAKLPNLQTLKIHHPFIGSIAPLFKSTSLQSLDITCSNNRGNRGEEILAGIKQSQGNLRNLILNYAHPFWYNHDDFGKKRAIFTKEQLSELYKIKPKNLNICMG